MDAMVLGNATLDVLCYPVDDVPRHDSIGFERADVAPGGCGSNVAVGLAALGVPVALVAAVGTDPAGALAWQVWQRMGIDLRWARRLDLGTGVSVGLVDHDLRPRFLYTPAANQALTPRDVQPEAFARAGARWLHIAGYFVLPGLLTPELAPRLAEARALGLRVSLDVVTSPAMDDPTPLWPLLPHVDVFFANDEEARRLTGLEDVNAAAQALLARGPQVVIVKLGAQGSLALTRTGRRIAIPAVPVPRVIDTTGAGDAYAAGFLAARLRGADLEAAMRAGARAAARVIQHFGAIAAWLATDSPAGSEPQSRPRRPA